MEKQCFWQFKAITQTVVVDHKTLTAYDPGNKTKLNFPGQKINQRF
jgi:hypothetical protein